MTARTASRVAEILTGLGRTVTEEAIADELAELEGLDEAEATTMLLAAYGVDDQGRPTAGFVPDRSSLESVLAVAREGPLAIGYVLAAALLGLVPALAVPLLIRLFVDRYLVDGDTQWVVPVVVGLLGAAFTASVLVALQYATLRMFALRLSKIGQVGFTWHVLGMRIPSIGEIGPGNLVARSNARQRMSYQGGVMLPMAAVNAINTFAFTIALLALDPIMCAAAVGVCAVTVIGSLLVLRWRNPLQIKADDEFAALSGTTADLVAAIESIKAAGWEQFAFARWARIRSAAARSVTDLGVANQWLALLPTVALALGLGLVLGVGCVQVINGALSIGSLVASQAFVAMLLESVGMLVFMGVLIQSVVSAARQADAVMRQPLDPEFVDLVPDDRQRRLVGDLRLRGVSFGYDRAAPALVQGLDLVIPAGARIALVGRSGSGKTTIARLVTGELRPWSGVVEIDGTPRLRVPRGVRTRGIAYVPQQAVLFPGSIRDNLSMWDDAVTDDDLRRAAADACIEATILGRPGGYYAMVSNQDSGFSGGEMQRLSIARALVRDPAILVLDEATSALDPVVEEQVEANLRRRGCTCLIVAHRISTVRDADEILVIDDGHVVQRGPFEDIKSHGFFAELLHG